MYEEEEKKIQLTHTALCVRPLVLDDKITPYDVLLHNHDYIYTLR